MVIKNSGHYQWASELIDARSPYWPEMGLITHHDPEPKREILKEFNITEGDNIQRLLDSEDLSYYNNGVRDFYFPMSS